jgi:hypothetical protein
MCVGVKDIADGLGGQRWNHFHEFVRAVRVAWVDQDEVALHLDQNGVAIARVRVAFEEPDTRRDQIWRYSLRDKADGGEKSKERDRSKCSQSGSET